MITRIFIENYPLDINQGLSNQITYALDDLQNIDSKATTFSKTIILPGTANNNKILGNIFEFNNSNYTTDTQPNVLYNYNAAKSATCRIEVNGLVIAKGSFRLLEIINDNGNIEYECFLIGELGGFVMKLGANKLTDLDFSEHDFDISEFNPDPERLTIKDFALNDNSGKGIYWPCIDYGGGAIPVDGFNTYKHNWPAYSFRPALFVKEYIDKIFAQAGYTYECDLFNTDRFKRLIIPHNQKEFTQTFPFWLNVFGEDQDYDLNSEDPEVVENIDFQLNMVHIRSDVSFTVDATTFTYNGISPITGTSGNTLTGTATFNIAGSYEKDTNRKINIKLYKNATVIDNYEIGNGSLNGEFNHTFTGNYTLVTDDIFYVIVISTYYGHWNLTIDSLSLTFGNGIPVRDVVNYDRGKISINASVIPQNILQKDFFTSILKLFNLYVYEERFKEKHMVIKPWVDFFVNGTDDWSDKVDRGKAIKIKPMSELNSRYYQFMYRDDNDYYNEQYRKRYNQSYGSMLFDSTYEFANETDKAEIIFSPTVLVGYDGEDKVFSTILKASGEGAAYKEEKCDSNIRILQARVIDNVSTWSNGQYNVSNPATGNPFYPYAGHFDNPDAPANDLNFGSLKQLYFALVSGALNVTQFNVYYSAYMAEITDKDSRLMTCYMKLNDTDIFNLDFAKYKFIDGGLYRLHKVIDYVPGGMESTKVQLLRVIYTTY
jgi:hypothetical protein